MSAVDPVPSEYAPTTSLPIVNAGLNSTKPISVPLM